MRVDFNAQYSVPISEIRKFVEQRSVCNGKTVSVGNTVYKLERIASVICKVEFVASFISHCTGKEEITLDDILKLFRTTTNSDIPFFGQFDTSMLSKLQNTLYFWTYKNSAEWTVLEYAKYPSEWKILNVNWTDGKLQSLCFRRDAYSNYRNRRYVEELREPLRHVGRGNSFEEIKTPEDLVKADLIYYFNQSANEERCIQISNAIKEYSRKTYNPSVLYTTPRESGSIHIDIDEMITWAKEIDQEDAKQDQNNNWEGRIKDLIFSVPTKEGLKDNKSIDINGILHAVGALSVGKSTFITVCSYGMAKKDKRVAIFLNTTTDVLKTVDYLNKVGINTIPLLSPNLIDEHANQYLSTLKSHHDLFEKRRSFRYISDSCVLLNTTLEQDDYFCNDKPPCNQLYVKVLDKKGKQVNERAGCPFICTCPRFNNIRDLDNAQVIVSTINSAVQAYMPAPFVSVQMTILEYLIRTCDIAFVDESDKVQANLDAMFCKRVNIYGNTDIFYRSIKNRILEYQESGEVPDSEHVLDFIRGTSNIEYFSTNIVNFLTTTVGVEKLFNEKIFDHLVTSQLLWKDLFEQAISVGGDNVEEYEMENTIRDMYQRARSAFINAFKMFQNDLLRGGAPTSDDELIVGLRMIASNLADESKLISDLNRLVKLKFSHLLKWEEGEVYKREDFIDIPGLYSNWDKPLGEIVDRIVEKIRFITDLYMLEHKLKFVLEKWELVRYQDTKLASGKNQYPGSLKQEFAGIVPALPIDVNYGFIINKDTNGRIKIDYMNFEGIGRWILLNFDKLYRDLDGISINCVLLSGTSNMATSPKYNIDIPVGCLLRKSNAKKPKLLMYYPVSIVSRVSGASHKHSASHLNMIADNLFNSKIDPNSKGYLPSVYERLHPDRRRALFSHGSYIDSRTFSDRLGTYGINSYNLVRPGDLRGNGCKEIERGKIEDVAKFDIDALSIPLGIGRGYNIITEISDYIDFINDTKGDSGGGKIIAAIGAAFFVKRPFYIPNDINTMITWLNSAYVKVINRYKNGGFPDFDSFQSGIIRSLFKTIAEFENIYGYISLSQPARLKLLGDTIVDIYQLACRLIRGDVDAEIHFIDSSFAPNTAKEDGSSDTVATSMLLGWRNMLREMVDKSKDVAANGIYTELYQILLDGLEMITLNERGQ